jgi:hypothetical protein
MFITDKQLIDDAKALGFNEAEMCCVVRTESTSIDYGYTIEQLERWLWDEHYISVEVERFCDDEGTTFVSTVWLEEQYAPITKERSIEGFNPFSARLEGVKKAVEYLKEGSK